MVLLVQSPKNYKKDWRIWKYRTSGDYPNYNIIENGPNTEECPGDLSNFVTLKKHQLTLMWKTRKE